MNLAILKRRVQIQFVTLCVFLFLDISVSLAFRKAFSRITLWRQFGNIWHLSTPFVNEFFPSYSVLNSQSIRTYAVGDIF